MRGEKIAMKRRMWITPVFVLGITVAWWFWTRSRPPERVVVLETKQPFVQLALTGGSAADKVMRERADLFDPTPLFYPTDRNFGQRPLPESMRRQPGQVFGSYDANYVFGEQNIKAYGSEAASGPERPADILRQGNETPFAGMGQIDVQRPALAERSAFLEVTELGNRKIAISQSLKWLSIPRLDFAPIEFLVVVSSSGLVGEPVLMTELGLEEADEEVDAYFRSYLVKSFHLGERLSPGRYRVLVGP